LAVLFGGRRFAVGKEFDLSGDPAAAGFHVLVELRFLEALFVAAATLYKANEKQIFVAYPELRRVQIALFRPDDINVLALPFFFMHDRKIDAQALDLLDSRRRRLSVNVEPEHEQW